MAKKTSTAKTGAKKQAVKKAVKKAGAKKRAIGKPSGKASVKKAVSKKKAVKKAPAKKAVKKTAKKAPAKKKAAAKKGTGKKAPAKKPVTKKPAAKKPASAKAKARKRKKFSKEEVYANNIAFLSARVPQLLHQIKDIKPLSELVWLDNGEADVAFRNIYLYNEEGADTATKKKLQEFNACPYRMSLGQGASGGLDQHSRPVFEKIVERGKKANIRMAGGFTEDKCFYLFILGFGLGKHVAELIRKYKPNHVTIFEPNKEFLHHSLWVADWEEIFDEINQSAAVIHIDSGDTPSKLAYGISGRIRSVCPPVVDGAVINRHYSSSIFDNGIKMMEKDVLKTTLMGLGFFEDDMTMISHSYRNLVGGQAKIMKWLDHEKNIKIPVFLIGNGPSLDGHMDFIRENQDRVIIISSGTALDPLLHEGIIPDFQIQIERDVGELAVYQLTAKNFDISKINLVASSTIYPDIAPMFGETVFFFRPGLSSLPLFKTANDQSLPLPDPSVTNTGLSFALHAGFREFYFFGCDMGAKSKEYHHAKKSVYSEDDSVLPAYLAGQHKEKLKDSFNHELPGNFGGTVLTSDVLLWTKNTIESLISVKGAGRFFYNCSDGAFIKGTLPKHTSSMFFPDIKGGKKQVVDELMTCFPTYTAEMFDESWERGNLFETIPALTDNLKEIFKTKKSLYDKRYLEQAMTYLKPSEATDAPAMLYRGSLMLLFAMCDWYLNRMSTKEGRNTFEKIIKEEVITFLDELRDEAVGDFKNLVEEYKDCRVTE